MLVMIGDSVTDASRAQPVGEGLFEALGKGYVNLVTAHFGSTFPERRIRVVNMGCNSTGHMILARAFLDAVGAL